MVDEKKEEWRGKVGKMTEEEMSHVPRGQSLLQIRLSR